MSAKTLFEKIWDSHVVFQEADCPAVLYIDLHLIHEVTSPQAFQGLREKGLPVHRPDCTVATIDHIIPTIGRSFLHKAGYRSNLLALTIRERSSCHPPADGHAKIPFSPVSAPNQT